MAYKALLVVLFIWTSTQLLAQTEFKVLENRRIMDTSIRTWPYPEDEAKEKTYYNFEVFLGGITADLFPSSTYRTSSYIYIGVNVNSPIFNKAGFEIHIPLYLLDIQNKNNLTVREIPEGINLLQKLYFRADHASRSFFKIEYREVKRGDKVEFLKALDRHEASLAKVQNVPMTDISFGISDRESRKLKDLSELILESIDIIQRTSLEKERTSVAYVIQPLGFRKDFVPKSIKNENLTVDRTFDPVLRTNAGEVRFPYLVLDVFLKSYLEIEGLPSDYKVDFRCSGLAEKITRFSETLTKYANLLTPQQRVFETNLFNVSNDYIYLSETYGSVDGQDPSDDNFGYDDGGFLVEVEAEPVESSGKDELVSEYCAFIRHANEFGAEIERNKDPDFRRYYQGSLDDIRGCLDLNFARSISDPELSQKLKECK